MEIYLVIIICILLAIYSKMPDKEPSYEEYEEPEAFFNRRYNIDKKD